MATLQTSTRLEFPRPRGADPGESSIFRLAIGIRRGFSANPQCLTPWPVRLDGPTLWNVDRTLTGSGALRFGYRVSSRSTLSLGAEALRQQDAAWAVIPTAGLTLTFGGSR